MSRPGVGVPEQGESSTKVMRERVVRRSLSASWECEPCLAHFITVRFEKAVGRSVGRTEGVLGVSVKCLERLVGKFWGIVRSELWEVGRFLWVGGERENLYAVIYSFALNIIVFNLFVYRGMIMRKNV